MTHPAADCAARVVAAGWPVLPVRTDVDDKAPTVRWRTDPVRSVAEMDRDWPRWAAICGVPRASDGRALVCVDADGPTGVASARSLFKGSRVRTGRGEHTWLTYGPDAPAEVRSRFYIGTELDWRGGDCYALLPGSQWRPVTQPDVIYRLVDGLSVADAPPCSDALLHIVSRRAPQTRAARAAVPTSPVRSDADSAYQRFLDAAKAHGREVRQERPGRAWVACPTEHHPHGNRRPALLVTAKPGVVTLYCFARQCPTREVVEALGLTLADLYDPIDLVIELEG